MNNGNYLEDLVESTPSDFCIGVGGYPEKHFESADMLTDIKYLKKQYMLF